MTPAEDRWKAVGEFIRSQRRVADMSLRQLSNLAKVSNPYLSQIERGIYKPSAEVLKSIADALQIRSETLFARAGFIDEASERGPSDVERAVRSDPRLSTEQKRSIISIYRSFVGEAVAPEKPAAKSPKQDKTKPKQGT
ncbi:MAG: helix-turn-helix transcriptional regulator [Actinomycetota bacterium]